MKTILWQQTVSRAASKSKRFTINIYTDGCGCGWSENIYHILFLFVGLLFSNSITVFIGCLVIIIERNTT